MITTHMPVDLSIVLLAALMAALAGSMAYQQWVAYRLNRRDWNELVDEIRSLNRSGIATVADDYLRPEGSQLRIEPQEIWAALGGIEGVKSMRRNATILIALAAYAERWNYAEGAIVAQRMRDDALQLRRATRQILWRMRLGFGVARVPFFLHQSAASYHLMTSRLLKLYEGANRAFYPRLAGALG